MGNTLGLDIGITSIGTALLNEKNVVYMGVRMFDSAQEASVSRKARSQRRNLSRKRWRKEQLLDAFDDFGVISKNELKQEGYLSFTTNDDSIVKPIDRTVYHLRSRALKEKVSKREILLCLYNVLHARGHFLSEMINFEEGENYSFDDFKKIFYDLTSIYISYTSDLKKEIDDILLYIFESNKIVKDEIRLKVKGIKNSINEYEETKLENIMYILSGYKGNALKIDDKFDKYEKCYINKLKSTEEDIDDFLIGIVELYDMAQIHKVLKNHNYICEVAVDKLDEFYAIADKYKANSEEFKETINKLKENVAKEDQKHYRVVRNLGNVFPNGLYVKECKDILKNQQQYYSEITDEFIEVCKSIVSARIPYYIGPLNEEATNAWVKKNGKIKYSYSYALKDDEKVIDVPESIKKWKSRMISHCTYLPEYEALPKGSFISETFNILNELNILTAIDKNGNEYYLTTNDKFDIFNNLFLEKEKIEYKEVAKLLDLENYGPKSNKDLFFNNDYTLYFQIVNIVPRLKLKSIDDFFNNKDKIDEIEDIVLALNLYDEEKIKVDYFKGEYGEDVAKKLAKLKSTSFCSYSREFVLETTFDTEGNSLIDKLFEDNKSTYKNEQMTLISRATDMNGNHIDYLSNKYVQRIKDNNNKLDYKILVDDDKPIIPISRPVLRSLNECMKVYLQIVESYGVPERIVIETARDFKDFSENKVKTVKFSDNAKKQYENLLKELKDSKYKVYSAYNQMDKFSELEDYLTKNKDKISLYISQMGTDLLTGEKIYLNNLDAYEIDHILPRGFGDNSMDDKMLIAKKVNAKKDNRLPIQFINSNEQVEDHKILIESEFLKRVTALYDMGAISQKKYERLTLKNSDELDEFLNQNLVDTRYIIREFMSILRAYNQINNYNTHIVALKSAYTSTYRMAFGMDKVREYGDQHHAHDAALLCIADKTLSTFYPNYDRREYNKVECENKFNSYNGFLKAISDSKTDNSSKNKLKNFIKHMYRKAYDVSVIDHNSIIDKVKNYVPYYSLKVERNYTGKLFKATILPQKNYKEDDALTIIGVNDDKKVFTYINSVAVDFYKFTNKKGKKEHLAVHIPKAIVDKDGNIIKEKYVDLIKKHYKKPEVLDENDEPKCFRFRAFRNDLVYETENKTLFKFNIGSIANGLLEMKFVNIFSYNDIYAYGQEIRNLLCERFDIKTKLNKEGNSFSEISKEEMVKVVNDVYWKIPSDDKKIQTTIKKVSQCKNVYDFSNLLAYIGLLINRPGTPPTIDGQYMPAINTKIITKADTEYVKLKYNILGVKTYVNNDGGFEIRTPIQGQFTKVRKEEFSWQVSKNSL